MTTTKLIGAAAIAVLMATTTAYAQLPRGAGGRSNDPAPLAGVVTCRQIIEKPGIMASVSRERPEILANIEHGEVKRIAKELAQSLENEPITDSDIITQSFDRLVGKFKTALLNQIATSKSFDLKNDYGLSARGVRTGSKSLEYNWIEYMSDQGLSVCFPDLVETLRKIQPRAVAAIQEAKVKKEGQATLAKLPRNVLGVAYAAYIDLKRCSDLREGYAAIYVSVPEMERAKDAIQQIERALKPKLDPDTTADYVWSYVAEQKRIFVQDRSWCQYRLHDLLQMLQKQVPESGRVEKDF